MSSNEVKEALLARSLECCELLLPNGKKKGDSYRVGNLEGEPGDSLAISLSAGTYYDHATGEKGGNLLDLWMGVKGGSFRDTLSEARAWLGCPVAPKRRGGTRKGRVDHSGATEARVGKTPEPFDWDRQIERLTKTQALQLANSRGYSVILVGELSRQGLIGFHGGSGMLAFPVVDSSGVVCNAQLFDPGRVKNPRYAAKNHPVSCYVVGDLNLASTVHVHESQWDLLADLEASGWVDGSCPTVAFIATRGANNGKKVGRLVHSGQKVVFFLQNDCPQASGRVPAECWLEDALESLPPGTTTMRVNPPSGMEDWQAWLKATGISEFGRLARHAALSAEPIPGRSDGGDAIVDPEESTAVAELSRARVEGPFDCYYDSDRKEYLIQNPDGRWIPQTNAQVKRRLKKAGCSVRAQDGEAISPAERFLIDTEDYQDVRYAAPLAGRSEGFYEENGMRFLVTESPRLIEPKPGGWSTLRAVFEGLLVSGEPEHGQVQLQTFYGWLQTGVDALRAGKHQHAQALAIAGPVCCGKSLVQHLITRMLGGRSAKAMQYMNGATSFNAELFEAEHLMLEDEHTSTKITDRLKLGASIKGFTVSTETQSCHRKNRTPVQLKPWWRVSITLNDDPEALRVLPPMNEDVADKIILLRAMRFKLPMATDTTEGKEGFWKQLVSEIPAFLDWLINEFSIPEGMRDSRYIVATFHHPDLLEALDQLSPEAQLLALADQALWSTPDLSRWLGTAEELREVLIADSRTRKDAEQLLSWANSTGTYLGRLAKKAEGRVRRHSANTADRRWILYK